MGTLNGRLIRVGIATFLTAGIAACGSDSTSPSTGPSNTTANGTTITVDSAVDAQIAVAGATIQVFVRVRSASGAPIPGDTVSWNVATGGGTVPNKTSVTDVNGIGAIAWTLGAVAGANSLGANINGAAVPINATGIVGPLASVTKISPDSQTVSATGSVLLTVKSADANGNAIANVNVTWTATGGLVTPTSAVTGTSGNSSVNFTTPAGVSRYTVTATAPGIPGVTFIIKTL